MKPKPTCYHPHPETNRQNPFLSNHTFKGSRLRHITVERAFCFAAKPISIMWRKTHAHRLYRFLKMPFEVIYGLNMNVGVKKAFHYSLIEYPRKGEIKNGCQ